jgi:hypothetical protein
MNAVTMPDATEGLAPSPTEGVGPAAWGWQTIYF